MSIHTLTQHSAVHVYDRNQPGNGFMFAIPVNDIPYRLNNGEWDGEQSVAFALINAWDDADHRPGDGHMIYRWMVANECVLSLIRLNGRPVYETQPDENGLYHTLHVPPKFARHVLENFIEQQMIQVAGKGKGRNKAISCYLRMLDYSKSPLRLSGFGLRQLARVFKVLAETMGQARILPPDDDRADFTDITEGDDVFI
uniref:hypothetical protein n=1 Tax=Salmonella enterica TaxID=28901 RepID=UPI003A90C377